MGPARFAQSTLGGGHMSQKVPYGSVAGSTGASVFGIAINITTAIIGLGVASMPAVWERGGLFTSLIFLCMGGVSSWAASCMNSFAAEMAGGAEDTAAIGQVVGGPVLAAFTGFSLSMQLLGSASAYGLLTPQQLSSVLEEVGWNIPYLAYDLEDYWAQLPAVIFFYLLWAIPSIFLKDMALLVKTSLIGILAVGVFLGACILAFMFADEYYLNKAKYPLPEENLVDPTSLEAYQRYEVQYSSKLFWGYMAVLNKFAFGYGVAQMIPTMKKDMAEPSKAPTSVTIAHIFVTVIYALFSMLAVTAIGGGVKCTDLVVNALAGYYRIFASGAVVVNLFVSFPLFVNPVCQLTERVIGIDKMVGVAELGARIINRSLILGFSLLIVLSVEGVLDILDLSTAFFVSFNTSLFPALFYWRLCKVAKTEVPGIWCGMVWFCCFWFSLVFIFGGYQASWPLFGEIDFAPYQYFMPDRSHGCNPDRSMCHVRGCFD